MNKFLLFCTCSTLSVGIYCGQALTLETLTSTGDPIKDTTITFDIKGTKDTPIIIKRTLNSCIFQGQLSYVKFEQAPDGLIFTQVPDNIDFVAGYSNIEVPQIPIKGTLTNIRVKGISITKPEPKTTKENKIMYMLP